MKVLTVVALLLLGIICAELRFGDGEMMRSHHNHTGTVNGPIKVFIMPHSHDDVGWLKTVDDYFYGADQSTQWAGVQYTIDTVVSQLALNPTYKFSIVEVAFLYRWWNNANSTMRNLLLQHIKNNQLEIINAGWCMSDEANPYYEDVVDQMTTGFRWVKDTLGVVPTIGWHIDPFGHQASNAAMFSQMGFNAWFFARIDRQDKSARLSNKGMEMIWHPTQYSGIDNYIFTHVNYYHYSPPPGFCFDSNCRDDPIHDDPTLDNYNLNTKSQTLVDYFKNQSLHFRSSNLFHTLGEDFHYSNARMWYKNFDKLIKYINDRPQFGVTVNYATPSEYLKAVNDEGNSYPTKYDDFFPYADVQHGFWTGYFVSRTSLKGFIRELGREFQTVKNHLSLLKISNTSDYIRNNPDATEKALWQMDMSMGILQHHDAVAGTAKQKVTNNYIVNGCKSWAILNKFYNEVRKEQIKNDIGETVTEIFTNTTWNGTYPDWGIATVLAANKTVLLNLYNPGPKGTYPVKIKVDQTPINLVGSDNSQLSGQIICSSTKDAKDCELVFSLAFEETATNYVKLHPNKSSTIKIIHLKEVGVTESTRDFNISSTATLRLTKATQKFDLNISSNVFSWILGYNYYESYQGDGQKSGAYIFRPSNATINTPKKYSNIKTIHYAEGTVATVIVLEADKTYTKMYFYKQPKYVDTYGFMIETLVDPIDVSDKQGKQVTLNLGTFLANNKTFYTDSNGLQEQKRILDYRPTWAFVNDEPVSGNYYPINSHISIIDANTKQKVSVLVDRSQGGGAVRDSNIEIMIQRRTVMDDSRGVGEPLDEFGINQKVRHWVVIGNANRAVQKMNDQKILISWANTATATFTKKPTPKAAFPVPDNVKLYLRPFKDGTYLLRLMNFDTDKQATVNIPTGWDITEHTLGFNQLLSEWKAKQYKWKEEQYDLFTGQKPQFNERKFHITSLNDGTVTLKPFQIRTFKLTKTE